MDILSSSSLGRLQLPPVAGFVLHEFPLFTAYFLQHNVNCGYTRVVEYLISYSIEYLSNKTIR